MSERGLQIHDGEDVLQSLSATLSELYLEDQYKDYCCPAFTCSRMVLRAALPEVSKNQYEAKLGSIPASLREKLLRYFYCWQLSVDWHDLQDLMTACCVLGLHHLQKKCENYVVNNAPPKDYVKWVIYSRKNGLPNLSQFFLDRIIFDLKSLMYSDEFLQLPVGYLEDLLEHNVDKDNVDIKFEATLGWLCVDFDRIHHHSDDLLKLIDVEKCSLQVLALNTNPQFAPIFHRSSAVLGEIQELLHQQAVPDIPPKWPSTESRSSENEPKSFTVLCDTDFARSMREQYLTLRDTHPKDISVTLSNGSVMAQKIILAATCPYFTALFRTGGLLVSQKASISDQRKTISKQTTRVTSLEFLDDQTVRALVQYMYSGTMCVSQGSVLECMIASDYLQMQNVCKECCKHLESFPPEVTTENCLQLMKLSVMFELAKSGSKCAELLAKNVKDFCEDEGIAEFSLSELLRLLNHNNMVCLPARYLYKFCVTWLKGNSSQHLNAILQSRAMLSCIYNGDEAFENLLEGFIEPTSQEIIIWSSCLQAMTQISSSYKEALCLKEKKLSKQQEQFEEEKQELYTYVSKVSQRQWAEKVDQLKMEAELNTAKQQLFDQERIMKETKYTIQAKQHEIGVLPGHVNTLRREEELEYQLVEPKENLDLMSGTLCKEKAVKKYVDEIEEWKKKCLSEQKTVKILEEENEKRKKICLLLTAVVAFLVAVGFTTFMHW